MQRTKYLVVAVLMLCLGLPIFAQKTMPQQQLNQSFNDAMDLFQKEKYASAQHQFDLLARNNDAGASALQSNAVYFAAVCSEKLGNDDANYRLEEFLRLYPQSDKVNMARFFQGNYLYGKSCYAEALNKYLQVVPTDVEYGYRNEYNFKVGYCYLITGETEKAKGYFQRIITTPNKYQSSALYYYAHIQYMQGDYDLAAENFQKLAQDSKFKAIVPSYLARIYYYLGREDDLLAMAPSMLERDDIFRKGELQQMVGEVYFNRGEYQQAINYYRKAEKTYREDDSKNSASAPSTNKLGNEEPVKNLTSNLPVCQNNDNTYQMGYSYYMLKQYDSAACYLQKKSSCNDSISQNAVYTLADTYIHLKKKDEARSMFLQASQMNYDAKIKEDALFNYAKLGCELQKNPYNESIRSFEDYLQHYPKTKHRTEVEEILTGLYLTTRNYKDALTLIEKINPKSAEMNQAYQRIVVNRGIELFNGRDINDASDYFLKAIKINAVPKTTTDAYYLYGESQYRTGNKNGARSALNKFFMGTNAQNSPYYQQALYTDAYLKMEQNNYLEAGQQFRHFLTGASQGVEARQRYDAYNRLGDCLYAQKSFSDAVDQYDVVIKANAKDADYATYQKALCYGALGKNDQKLTYLNYIFEKYETSLLAPKALLEIANTYLVLDNNDMSLLYYNKFLNQYPQNSHVKEALLDRGLIYYNTGKDSLALASFDQLLKSYPGTDESRDALVTVKNIYMQQNRVDEYFSYVQQTTKSAVSSNEQDSLTYQVAANYYTEGDCDNAISGMERYLQHFPNGLFSQTAHYYLADCLFKSGLNEKALPHYELLASQNKNQYTETAVANAANIAYGLGNYTKALDNYVRLVAMAEDDNTRLAARLGLLRCYVKMDSHNNIVATAGTLLAEPKVTADQRDEARMAMAHSYWNINQYDSAAVLFTKLKKSSNGDYSGEANYRLAQKLYIEHNYAASEKAIEAIAANPGSDYWLAKSFILWSDIFYAQGNTIQAKQTLQSIIDNYDGDDLVTEAIQKRNVILQAEANASAKANAAQEDKANEEIIITIPGDEDGENK
jgi:TolA-binding protein